MTNDLRATIRVFNYRCFGSETSGVLELRAGFTAFVGPNNSGKSTILRLPRDLRGVFGLLGDEGQLTTIARGNPVGANITDAEAGLSQRWLIGKT